MMHPPPPPTTRWREEVVVIQEDAQRPTSFGYGMMLLGSTILIRGCWYTDRRVGENLMYFGGAMLVLGFILHAASRLADASTRR